jgi:hypothetical protein
MCIYTRHTHCDTPILAGSRSDVNVPKLTVCLSMTMSSPGSTSRTYSALQRSYVCVCVLCVRFLLYRCVYVYELCAWHRGHVCMRVSDVKALSCCGLLLHVPFCAHIQLTYITDTCLSWIHANILLCIHVCVQCVWITQELSCLDISVVVTHARPCTHTHTHTHDSCMYACLS